MPNSFVSRCETPALVLNESVILRAIRLIKNVVSAQYFRVLYTLKPLPLQGVLQLMLSELDGFSVSSPFELQLARELGGRQAHIHYSAPGLQLSHLQTIRRGCNSISFNSLDHYHTFGHDIGNELDCGIRVNPKLSFVNDERYDPCRPHSKLGVPLDAMQYEVEREISQFRSVKGLHFHNNCDSEDLSGIAVTAYLVEEKLGKLFGQLRWINLGGGYIFNEDTDFTPLKEIVTHLHSTYGLTVFMEPGASLVRSAGVMVSTVLDLFESDGRYVAVLDTTVNHMPEVFEYQYEPDVLGHREDGEHTYMLAGCSCLAGDILGVYSFDEPLQIGSRIIITGMGAYTFAKANMFNGINLPSLYLLKQTGELVLIKSFGYEHFLSLFGANGHEDL